MSQFFLKKPKDFQPKVEVSAVFMEFEKKLLLLQRCSHKIAPDLWAIPGGKLEKGETPLEGLIREIEEELQIFPDVNEIHYKKSFYVRHSILNYRLHLFQWILKSKPLITIDSTEHQAFYWQPINKFKELPLLEGQLEAFHFVYHD